MLDPRWNVPRVMVGSLVLGGVASGCGDDLPQGDILSRVCVAYAECSPDDFAEEYGTVEACEQGLNAYVADLRTDYGAACSNALLNYYECILPGYEATCVDSPCQDEYDAAALACEWDIDA